MFWISYFVNQQVLPTRFHDKKKKSPDTNKIRHVTIHGAKKSWSSLSLYEYEWPLPCITIIINNIFHIMHYIYMRNFIYIGKLGII